MAGTESRKVARELDRALAASFPASDPPSMTSPSTATPSAGYIAPGGSGEIHVYRVIRGRDAAQPFAPTDSAGRWTPAGASCVYASMSPATALLEFLAHLEGRAPDGLLLAVAAIPAGALLDEVNAPSTWCQRPYREEVQQVGARWLAAQTSLALRVPCAICRNECNVLLNPKHRDYATLQVVALAPLDLDDRLRA
jgi:RES domain-containing protein